MYETRNVARQAQIAYSENKFVGAGDAAYRLIKLLWPPVIIIIIIMITVKTQSELHSIS